MVIVKTTVALTCRSRYKERFCNHFWLPCCQTDISPCLINSLFLKLSPLFQSRLNNTVSPFQQPSWHCLFIEAPCRWIIAHLPEEFFLLVYLTFREPLLNPLPHFIWEGVITHCNWHQPISRSVPNLVLVPVVCYPWHSYTTSLKDIS